MSAPSRSSPLPTPTADLQVAKVFEWRRGFNAMHLIDIGIQLGLFRALASKPGIDSQSLASQLGLHAPYVKVWCMTAYSFGLLEADEETRFRLAPFVNEILANPSHPRYLGGYVQLGTRFATDDHRYAMEGFRTGATSPFQGRSEEFAQVVAQAIAGVNVLVARKILPGLASVGETLRSGGSLLEVGCGTGNLQIQIAKAFPAARCAGIDIDPTSVQCARAAVSQAGLSDRVTIIEGDIVDSVQSQSFDVIVMVEVLHEIGPNIRPRVVAGCANALRKGGWLVVVDETYPSTLAEAREPEFQFPIQTGFEELMWGNVIPTRDDQEQLLRTAGFTGPIDRSLLGAGFTLLTTQR